MVNKIKMVRLWRQVVCSALALLTLVLMGCNKDNQFGMQQTKNREGKTIIAAEGVNLMEEGANSSTQNSIRGTGYCGGWWEWLNKLPSLGRCLRWMMAGGSAVALYVSGMHYVYSREQPQSRNARHIQVGNDGFECVRNGRGFLYHGMDFYGSRSKVLDVLRADYIIFPPECFDNSTNWISKSQCVHKCTSLVSHFCSMCDHYNKVFGRNLGNAGSASGVVQAYNISSDDLLDSAKTIALNFRGDIVELADKFEEIMPKELLVCDGNGFVLLGAIPCKEKGHKEILKKLFLGVELLRSMGFLRHQDLMQNSIICIQDALDKLKRRNSNSDHSESRITFLNQTVQNLTGRVIRRGKIINNIRTSLEHLNRLEYSNMTDYNLVGSINEKIQKVVSESKAREKEIREFGERFKNFIRETSENFTAINETLTNQGIRLEQVEHKVDNNSIALSNQASMLKEMNITLINVKNSLNFKKKIRN